MQMTALLFISVRVRDTSRFPCQSGTLSKPGVTVRMSWESHQNRWGVCTPTKNMRGQWIWNIELWKYQTVWNIYVQWTWDTIFGSLNRQHFQIVDFSRSWAVGDFRHPAGGKVPSAWTHLDLIDSRFVRFRSRSDCTEIFSKKYLKTKKLEHFQKVRVFLEKKVTFSSISEHPQIHLFFGNMSIGGIKNHQIIKTLRKWTIQNEIWFQYQFYQNRLKNKKVRAFSQSSLFFSTKTWLGAR